MSAYEIYSPEDDDAAFAAVYRAHSAKLLRYCQYRLHDRHEAEDVVQEAFARAWRTMPTTGTDRNFYPWLRVVAGNLCTDILRKRSRSQPVAVIELGSVDGDMDHVTEECDRVLVRQALGRLNDRHRSALMMREDEGLTYDQIAQRTGVTAGTVESLLWRARQALKREFTVLAGHQGSLAVVPVVAVVAARTRDAGRKVGFRALRRLAPFHSAGETPSLAHAAVAAVAALTVATGLAATLEAGGHSHGYPATVHGGVQTAAVTATTLSRPDAATAAVPQPAASVPTTPTTAPAASTTVAPVLSASVPVAPAVAPGQSPVRTPIRVVNPVAVGPSAAEYAQQSPYAVKAGQVTLGVSPSAVTAYAQHAVQTVAPPVASAVGITSKEIQP